MEEARAAGLAQSDCVRITNPDGRHPVVLLCDHASNFIPAEFGTLGLAPNDLLRHIAWDPGARPVTALMAAALDAVMIESCVSRLVADCNRPLDAPDLIPAVSETTAIPGNADIGPAERERRLAMSWRPFHDAIEAVVGARLARGQETQLVSIHSFTPVYKRVRRPWQIGIIHDEDETLARPLIEALRAKGDLNVGVNEPYSPADRVYFTLETHGRSRGLACAMIEIRNDEIRDQTGQDIWAERLAGIVSELDPKRIGQDPSRLETHRSAGQSTR